jgi:hypothetical protein
LPKSTKTIYFPRLFLEICWLLVALLEKEISKPEVVPWFFFAEKYSAVLKNHLNVFFFYSAKKWLDLLFMRYSTDNRSELVRSIFWKKLLVVVTFLGSFWQKKVLYGKICIKMLCFINFCQKVPRQYIFPDYF